MESLQQAIALIFELFADGFYSLLVVAVAGPLIGVLLVLRRMPLVGLAGPQLASCGQAAGHFFYAWLLLDPERPTHPSPFVPTLGACVMVAIGLIAIGYSSRDRRFLGVNAAIALILAIALQELFYLNTPSHHLSEATLHQGQLLTVSAAGRNWVLVCAAAVLVVVGSMWRGFWISAFDVDQARLLGLSPQRAIVVTLLLLGGFCAICAPVVGPLATLTLIIVPPAILRAATPSLAWFAPMSILAGVLGAVAGMVIACTEGVDWPPGPAIALSVTLTSVVLALLLGVIAKWRASRLAV